MTEKPENGGVHEIAGGWITERTGMPIPGFLKLAYVGFSLFGLYYMWTFWRGETTHATRGPLVQEMNKVIETPGTGFHVALLAILALFVAGLWAFAFRAKEGE